MPSSLVVPDHVKYRRESTGGLVYDHENYGYEDATLAQVDDVVIDVLEFVEEGMPTREEVENTFSPTIVDTLVNRGYLHHA